MQPFWLNLSQSKVVLGDETRNKLHLVGRELSTYRALLESIVSTINAYAWHLRTILLLLFIYLFIYLNAPCIYTGIILI